MGLASILLLEAARQPDRVLVLPGYGVRVVVVRRSWTPWRMKYRRWFCGAFAASTRRYRGELSGAL
jgi:hypothetical protein